MLLPNYLQHVADAVVALWEQLNLFAVKDIARRITDAGDHMTASADWQKYKMEQAGQAAAEIRKEVKRITNLSDADVKKIFEESMLTSYENDSKVFEAAGAKPQPFNTKEAQKLLKALYDQTNGELHNFTRTMPNASQQIYIKACDDALMRVSSGLQSKEQAIQEAIEKAAADGLYITYPSGHRDTVEVAVRRAVTTGVNQASLKMCVNECETVGTNYVIVSSHLGARTGDTQHGNHAGWQGQVYRLKDRKKGFWGMFEHLADMAKGRDYPLLEEATGYPTDPTGLGGYNCRHNMMPFFPGVSENHMKQYGAEENAEAYENSQKQRAKERDLRKRRRVIEADKAAGIDCKEEQAAYKEKLDEYNDFCKKNGLTPALERTYTAKSENAKIKGEPVYIHPDKISKFLLKKDAKHYKDFADVGYDPSDPQRLHDDIVKNYSDDKIEDRTETKGGAVKYNVRMDLGVSKVRPFITGWRIDNPGAKPRFITAFRQPFEGE